MVTPSIHAVSRDGARFKMILIGLVGIIIIAVLANVFLGGKNSTKRFDAWRKSGKSMLDDFDKERKDLDNLMK
ncbi:MAG: hypothetical protein ACLUU1_06450 [Ruminococcus sp.]